MTNKNGRVANFPPLVNLAIPLIVTGVGQSSVFFFETLFLAHLGPDILAAGALVSWLFASFAVMVLGLLSSMNILVAHSYGARQIEKIAFVVRDGCWLAIIIAIPASILFWNMSGIFLWLGQSHSLILLSEAYLHALTWGILADLLIVALLELMVGLGHTKMILKINFLCIALNIFFSYVLIFGKWGFPRLAIAGAGWGMTISYWATLLIVCSYLCLKRTYHSYFKKICTFTRPSYLLELIRIGFAIGIMYGLEIAFFFTLTIVVGMFGNSMLSAANQIALQYSISILNVVFCTAQAVTVRMGHLLGAKQPQQAAATALVSIRVTVVLMLGVAVVYWLFPKTLLAVDFNPNLPANQPVVHFTTEILVLCGIYQIFEATRLIIFGALRSLRDTHFPLLISFICFWIISLPVGYCIAHYLHLTATGLWWGMILGAFTNVSILYARLKVKLVHL